MKKILSLVMALTIMLSLAACGGDTTAETTVTSSAASQLSQLEELVVQASIDISNKDFTTPSEVRILEVWDYTQNSKYKGEASEDVLYGPDTVVVRLQGANKDTNVKNNYYMICLSTDENTSDAAKSMLEVCESDRTIAAITGNKSDDTKAMKYKGVAGEYAAAPDSYKAEKDASQYFNIGLLNNALEAHWKDLGL